MPLTSTAVYALGVVTLVLVILLCCVGVGCVGYVLHFRARIQRGRLQALQDFNALWIVRIILIVLAVVWSLVELLRLPLLRRPNWPLHSLSFQWQANMCRLYILSSLGFLEPCFFLTALFLVHGSLRNAPFTPRKRWNGKVVALILMCCLPVFLLQLFFVVISPSFEFRKGYNTANEGYHRRLPIYFTRAFEEVVMESHEAAAVCTYPLLSTLVLAAFGVIYSAYFLLLGWRMVGVVINRRLQRRVYRLLASLLFLLPLHVLLLGMSVLTRPTNLAFEGLGFLGFLTVLLSTTVGEGILVIRPIADALSVSVLEKLGQDIEAVDGGPLSIPLSVFGSEDDEPALLTRQLGKAVSGAEREYTAGGDTFRPVDRGGGFSDGNGIALFCPDSPALPGKPLLSHSNNPFDPFL